MLGFKIPASMAGYDSDDVKRCMGLYYRFGEAFGIPGVRASDISDSLTDLLGELKRIPVECRDSIIAEGISLLELHAATLDGITHRAEWAAAVGLLMPNSQCYHTPSRLERQKSDAEPYRRVCSGLLDLFGGVQKGSLPGFPSSLREFPFLTEHELNANLEMIPEKERYGGLFGALNDALRNKSGISGTYTPPFLKEVGQVMVDRLGPQLENLIEMDRLLD